MVLQTLQNMLSEQSDEFDMDNSPTDEAVTPQTENKVALGRIDDQSADGTSPWKQNAAADDNSGLPELTLGGARGRRELWSNSNSGDNTGIEEGTIVDETLGPVRRNSFKYIKKNVIKHGQQNNRKRNQQGNVPFKRPLKLSDIKELHRQALPSSDQDSDERTDLIDEEEGDEEASDGSVFRVVAPAANGAREEGAAISKSSGPALRIHGITTSSSDDHPLDEPESPGIAPVDLSTTTKAESTSGVRFTPTEKKGEETGRRMLANGGTEEESPGEGKRSLLDTQAGVVELSSMITAPGMKRAESMDLTNASLHQLARDGDVETMRRLLDSLRGNVVKKVNMHDDADLSALHYAARYNHVPVVQLLVQYNANVNDVDAEGGTPLHFAARYKRMRLGTQADNPNETTTDDDAAEDGDTAAHADEDEKTEDAAADEDEEDEDIITDHTTVHDSISQSVESTPDNSVIMFLASRKANVNAQDIYGCTPLHFAAMRGNEVAAKELMSSPKCNIEVKDKQSMTALHLAASHDEPEVVRMLISKGANLMCADEESGIPLHYACMEGSIEVVRMLFEAAEQINGTWVPVHEMVSAEDSQANTPLHLAVENRSVEVAKLCLEKGALVNATRDNYMTPLHLAAISGELELVQLLIEHNARVDALDLQQQTPLHAAAEYDHVEVLEYLLDKGADINRHDKDNYSALLLAAAQGNAKTIETLLKRKARIYDVDKSDKTALFLCAEEDKLEALQVLLAHPQAKALLDVSDRYDNTPLHVAAQNGYVAIVRELLDAGADIGAKNEEEQTPVHLAATEGRTLVVRELVKRNKTVVNHEDEDSNTALHLAALAGHNKVVKELVDCGADIEARNTTLWTPLDCAAAKGWPKIVRILLENDAPVDPMDKRKTTPLHLASGLGHVEVVNLLLEWKANVRQRDTNGNNCLDRAIEGGHRDVVKAIINSIHWREALMNETLDLNTGMRLTPMRKLITKMPDEAECVFSHCTTSEISNPDHPDYSITFNYEFLDDMYANWREEGMSETVSLSDEIYDDDNHLLPKVKPYTNDSGILKKNHPLSIMVRANQEDLLAHPLVTSLLKHKWETFGRYMYYINLLVFTIFMVFLTGYTIVARPPYLFKNQIANTSSSLSQCEQIRPFYSVNPVANWIFIYIGKYLIICIAGLNLLREIFQMYNSKLHYLGFENIIEWFIYIATVLFVFDFDGCQQQTGIRTDWQWQLGAVAIFLGWIEFVLFIRKLPRFGIYVVMFTDVLATFISFFPVFFIFIFAFAIVFYALFQDQAPFVNIGHSLVKTSVMMIGEFEYTDLFYSDDPPNYSEISYIIFVSFIVLMSIIIMNLLVGLAVDDIKAVQEQAVLKRLAMQVQLALDVESLLPQWIRRKFIRRCQVVFPNRHGGCWAKCPQLKPSALSSTAIQKALNPELNEIEQLQESQEKMADHINNLRFRVKTLGQQNETLTNMVQALLKHHNVEFVEEDYQEDRN